MATSLGWKGILALVAFVLQNSTAALLMRYAKLNSLPYSSSVAVLLQARLHVVECSSHNRLY